MTLRPGRTAHDQPHRHAARGFGLARHDSEQPVDQQRTRDFEVRLDRGEWRGGPGSRTHAIEADDADLIGHFVAQRDEFLERAERDFVAHGKDGVERLSGCSERGSGAAALFLAREAALDALEHGFVPGIVHGRGQLALDRPVMDYFPELADLASTERRQITVQHLLDMTVGWDWNESSAPYGSPANSETQMVLAADRNRHLLGLPMLHAPGTRWAYSGGATALLADAIERSTGQRLLPLAQAALFDPLGIPPPTWRTDREGRALAFSGLRLRPRELARIGRLLLDGGRWQGRPVVPADWIAATLATRVPASDGMT